MIIVNKVFILAQELQQTSNSINSDGKQPLRQCTALVAEHPNSGTNTTHNIKQHANSEIRFKLPKALHRENEAVIVR